MLKQLLLTSMLALLLGTPVLAQDSATAEATSQGSVEVMALPALVGADHRAQQSVLSPDGTMVAWFGKSADVGLCVLMIATRETECTPMPEESGRTAVNLAWSPDSKMIAYNDDFFLRLLESDIHLFDVASRSYRDVTDDHSTANTLMEHTPDVPQDYLPTWGADGSLYFWRSFNTDSGITLSLEQMATLDSQPEELRNMTRVIPGPYAVYNTAAISPDGSTMAIIVLQSQTDAPNNGIYTVNLKTREVDLIATVNQLRFGLPNWVKEPRAFPMAVYWAGSNLVVNLYNPDDMAKEPAYAVYIVLPSKRMMPIFDFSAYRSEADFASGAGGQPTGAALSLPGAGIPTPDGKQYLFVHQLDQETVEVASLPLPPDGTPATALATTAFEPSPAARANTFSADGKQALIFDYLVTLGG